MPVDWRVPFTPISSDRKKTENYTQSKTMLSSGLWPSWNQRLWRCILTVCLRVFIQLASAQGAAAEVANAQVGETVTLTAPVTVNIVTFVWYRGTAVTESQQICSCVVPLPGQLIGPQYTGRETCGPDESLQIRDLLTNYTGNYTVIVQPSGAPSVIATRLLRVYDLVSKPTVTSVPSQMVENRGLTEITCNASKASITILWSFNKSPELPGNILQSPDNRTLTIANVSRRDSGTYQCVTMNPISSSASDPQTLTVAYGPEDVRIDGPGSHSVPNGAKLSLSCSAGSIPAPQYQWILNDADLNRPDNTYTIEKVSARDNGNYTCVTHNTDTGRTVNTSVSITVNGMDFPPAASPSPCQCSCSCSCPSWLTYLGVACGVVLGAAIVVALVVLRYERRLSQNRSDKGEPTYQNSNNVLNPETHSESTRKGPSGQTVTQDMTADSAYMELRHRDEAVYEKINRP